MIMKINRSKIRHLDVTGSEKRQLDLRKSKFIYNINFIICDRFISKINKQIVAYIEIEEKFVFSILKNLDKNVINN